MAMLMPRSRRRRDHVEPFAAAGQRGGLGQLERQMSAGEAVPREQRRQAQRKALVASAAAPKD